MLEILLLGIVDACPGTAVCNSISGGCGIGSPMGEAALILLEGALMIAGLLFFFWLVGAVIEVPERVIRWLTKKKTPPQHHDHFDDPV
jgi:hypothetical protein